MYMAHWKHGIGIGIAIAMTAVFFCSRAVAAEACPVGPELTPGTQHCSSSKTGTVGGFGWSIWSTGGGGCITPSGNTAAFKATWNNSGDFLARDGFQWNETKTFEQIGNVHADYAYAKSGTGGGYSFVGIYGWSSDPLVEYYIVDDWFGTGSAPTAGGVLKGSFTVDSGTYKVYTRKQINQASIHGDTDFTQFYSVRQTPRQCGHISVSEHYKEWKSLGLVLGKMYEAKLVVEVGGGTGSIDYSVGSMTYGTAALVPRMQRAWPEYARDGMVYLGEGEGGVLSLVSLKGSVIRSARRNPSESGIAFGRDVPAGLYLLRFQGGQGAVTTPFPIH